ncbi:MAG: T9SS type A sorting domain-containing protein, partial [Bacteroidota bacterium]
GEDNLAANRGGNMPAFWTVDPSQYESSATLVGMLGVNGTNLTGASMELGAFVGNEVRGSAQAMFVEPLNSYLFFLTYYSNNNGDPISFKLYDSDNGLIRDLAQTMFFTADNHQGSMDIPFPFSYNGLSDAEEAVTDELSLDVRPNPFSQSTEIRFALKQASEVFITVTDLNGKVVTYFEGDGREGINALEWKGTSDSGTPLQSGVYFVKLKTDAGMAVRKVMLQR